MGNGGKTLAWRWLTAGTSSMWKNFFLDFQNIFLGFHDDSWTGWVRAHFPEQRLVIELNNHVMQQIWAQICEKPMHVRYTKMTSSSLHHKPNLTSVSNVCEAAPISLLWLPRDSMNYRKNVFEIPFILFGKSTMAFLTSQSWLVLKSWYVHSWGSGTRNSALFRRWT